MFLSRLYHHSKFLFFSIVIFLIVFLFLNIKWGVVATPVFQYGMFSGPMHIRDTQTICQLNVNDQPLNLHTLSFAKRDILFVSLQRYEAERQRNLAVFETMKRILSKVGMGKLMTEEAYTNHLSDKAFTGWYKGLLERITGEKVKTLSVDSRLYIWKDSLLPLSSPLKKGYIVAD